MEIFLVPPLISQMPAAELGNEAVLRHPFPDPLPVPVIVLVGQLNDPLFLPAAGLEERLLRQNDRAVPQIVMGRRSDQIDLLSQREYDLPPFSQAALPFQMVLPPSVIPPVDRAQESFQGIRNAHCCHLSRLSRRRIWKTVRFPRRRKR